ncbi:DUF6354 family protein [Streptomyces sp. NPDC051183]|uniref:DUF6354 family protein n=1 Tax=Streptomyces sp. NPDC051183 TaxID=3155165 RepID=UPI003445133B
MVGSSKQRSSNVRTVAVGQLYRDLAPDVKHRDRRLRVEEIGADQRASYRVEHDHGGPIGRTPYIAVHSLASRAKWELLEEAPAVSTDPRYSQLLAALAHVHREDATVTDYASAAWSALTPYIAPEKEDG